MNESVRRVGYIFLRALPFIALAFGSARPLRTAGWSQIIGVVLFTAVMVAAWLARPASWIWKRQGGGNRRWLDCS